MWTCPKCGRIFARKKQPHTCDTVALEEHFINKKKAKEIFGHLLKQVNEKIGKCQIISLPCCIHLFGKYDFLAALPKKDRLEIRFALDRKLDSPRLGQFVSVSSKHFKNCLDINSIGEVDRELLKWLNEAYNLKN